MDKHAADVLRKAKALIDRPEKWFGPRGHLGGDNCAGTAVLRAAGKWDQNIDWEFEAMKILARAMNSGSTGCSVASWNNTHTHADVMAAFDRAIALAEGHNRVSDEEYTKQFIKSVSAPNPEVLRENA